MKIALLCVGKHEEKYLKEYVEYYKKLGIDKIFFGDNQEINDDKQFKVLEKYINEGFVKWYDYRGVLDIQHKFYDDIYFKEKDNYDWYICLDIDEYIHLEDKFNNIKDFLNQKIFDNYDVIKIKVIDFLSSNKKNIFHYNNQTVIKRFETPINANYTFMQSFIRYNPNYYRITICYGCINNNTEIKCIFADNLKEYHENENYQTNKENSEVHLDNNVIYHYSLKSCDEFIDKIMKGRADTDDENRYFYNMYNLDKLCNTFCKGYRFGGFGGDIINQIYNYLYDKFSKLLSNKG